MKRRQEVRRAVPPHPSARSVRWDAPPSARPRSAFAFVHMSARPSACVGVSISRAVLAVGIGATDDADREIPVRRRWRHSARGSGERARAEWMDLMEVKHETATAGFLPRVPPSWGEGGGLAEGGEVGNCVGRGDQEGA